LIYNIKQFSNLLLVKHEVQLKVKVCPSSLTGESHLNGKKTLVQPLHKVLLHVELFWD